MSKLKTINQKKLIGGTLAILFACLLAGTGAWAALGGQVRTGASQDTKLDEMLGATSSVVDYLESHENDDYFLGTPYGVTGPNQTDASVIYCDAMYPNGDRKSNGDAYLNCAGFVAYVMRACGANIDEIGNYTSSSGYNKGTYTNASKWFYYCQDKGIGYKFDGVNEALNSGVLSKGDIIYLEPNWSDADADCHIGFFWGDTSNDNKFWHSAEHPGSGNQISYITGKTAITAVYVYKTKDPEKGGINLHKASSNPSISDDNKCYGDFSGVTYDIYDDAGNLVWTLVTDAAGNASTGESVLTQGTYYVKERECTASKGYSHNDKIYEVKVTPSKAKEMTQVNVTEAPQHDPIDAIIRKASKNGQAVSGESVDKLSQGSATYKGAQFTIRYYDTTDATSLSKNFDERVAAATRTWLFQTDVNGMVYFNEDYYFLSDMSDELYKDSNGEITLPIGTYVIEETNAPAGFTTPPYNERTFIEVLKPADGLIDEEFDSYHIEYYTPTGKTSGGITYGSLDWEPWKIDGEE